MQHTFRNSLAFRIHNLALKVEKASKDILKASSEDEILIYAAFQKEIEENLNDLFALSQKADLELKNLKKV